MPEYWLNELPWLQAENMQKKIYGDNHCHCLGGWFLTAFTRNPLHYDSWINVKDHVFVEELRKEALHRLSTPNGRSDLFTLNDDKRLSLKDLADIWNTCVRRRGYEPTKDEYRRSRSQ